MKTCLFEKYYFWSNKNYCCEFIYNYWVASVYNLKNYARKIGLKDPFNSQIKKQLQPGNTCACYLPSCGSMYLVAPSCYIDRNELISKIVFSEPGMNKKKDIQSLSSKQRFEP